MTKKKILQIFYVIISVGILAVLAYTDTHLNQFDFRKLPGILNLNWIILAITFLLLYWLSDTLIIYRAMHYMNHPIGFFSTLKISIIGLYYSALTPFSSGGQPVQVVYMKRYNAPIGCTTSVFVLKLLLWELALCILGAWALIFNADLLKTVLPSVTVWVVAGFALNLGVFFIGAASIFLPKQLDFLGRKVVWLLAKVRVIRNPDRAILQISQTIEDFNSAAEIMRTNIFMTVELFILTLFNMVFFFSITYIIYRALGNEGHSWLAVVLLQALLSVAVSFIPLPGASGASEGGFYLLFSAVFTGGTTFVGVLLWRIITYYSNLAAGFVIIMIDGFSSATRRE